MFGSYFPEQQFLCFSSGGVTGSDFGLLFFAFNTKLNLKCRQEWVVITFVTRDTGIYRFPIRMDLAGNITNCQNVFERHLTSFHFTTLTIVSVARDFSINYLDVEFISITLVKHKRLLWLFSLLIKSFLEVPYPRSHLEYNQVALETKEKSKLKYWTGLATHNRKCFPLEEDSNQRPWTILNSSFHQKYLGISNNHRTKTLTFQYLRESISCVNDFKKRLGY